MTSDEAIGPDPTPTDTADLVTLLRAHPQAGPLGRHMAHAADEIERLRAEVQRLKGTAAESGATGFVTHDALPRLSLEVPQSLNTT
jgi:hypothetical protein